MYCLFAALPFVGHLNPLLRQAEALRDRGWQVRVASTSELKAHVDTEGAGIEFLDLGPLGPIADRLRQAEGLASAEPDYRKGALHFLPVLAEIWPVQFDGLVTAMQRQRPDVLVADLFTSAAVCAAEAADVPCVINNPSLLNAVPSQLMPPAAGLPPVMSSRSIHDVRWWHRALEPLARRAMETAVAMTIGRQLTALRRSRGLPPRPLHDLLQQGPIVVNGIFGVDYERPLPPTVHMAGPMLASSVPPLPPDLAEWLDGERPVVYANLGTVATAPPAQVAKMVEAFDSPGTRVLWVVRDAARQALPPALPDSIRVVPRVPSPRAVLAHRRVKAFVSHCGINSVYESLAEGTPVVGIPMLSDQRDMAVRVSDAGLGEWMDKTRFTASQLRSAIDRVISERPFRERLADVRMAIMGAGGASRAADVIAAQARRA